MKRQSYDIIVIGGGASGMMAALRASERGRSVLLLEKGDRLGKKLRITGKGRCNVTNDCTERECIESIPTGGRFMTSAIYAFTPKMTQDFFNKLGVPLKTERGNRVFPVSDKASDIVDALHKALRKSGAEIIYDEPAREIITADGRVTAVRSENFLIPCSSVIIATGGKSYPLTGSTGDGYALAASLGHTVIEPKGSLVPLETDDDFCPKMQGLSLKNVKLTVKSGKKTVYEDFGEMLFTHFGVSGPMILSASAHLRDCKKNKYVLHIDLKPALDEKKLDARILRDFEKFSNRDFANSLGELLNRLMIPVIIERCGIAPDTKVHSVTREERRRLVETVKDFTLTVTSPRPVDEAIITSGGVDTREIDPRTFMSKKVEGLFFAGEVIDADAYTGGFNLQIAWASGYAAGNNA